MKARELAKGLALSISALAVGFLAIAVPFRIFDTLSLNGVKILFAVEIIAYIITGLIFLAVQDKKNKQKAKAEERLAKRELKVRDVMDNWYNIAA